MGKLGRWKEQMVSALEIPPDLAYSETIITMTGSMEILIENYKSISRYTPTEIVVRSLRGKVSICGKNLEILWYTSSSMKVTGNISGIYPKKQMT